jgi:hypothetical protein
MGRVNIGEHLGADGLQVRCGVAHGLVVVHNDEPFRWVGAEHWPDALIGQGHSYPKIVLPEELARDRGAAGSLNVCTDHISAARVNGLDCWLGELAKGVLRGSPVPDEHVLLAIRLPEAVCVEPSHKLSFGIALAG